MTESYKKVYLKGTKGLLKGYCRLYNFRVIMCSSGHLFLCHVALLIKLTFMASSEQHDSKLDTV